MASLALKYRLDLDDYIALNLYALGSSPSHRLFALAARAWPALALLAMLGVESYHGANWFDGDEILLALAVAVVWCAAIPIALKWRMRRQLLAYATDSPDALWLGTVETELAPHGIIADRAKDGAPLAWNSVERLAETRRHLFIFADGAESLIIPKRQLGGRAQIELVKEFVRRNAPHAAHP